MKLKEFIETFEQPCCGGLSKEDVEIALKKQAEEHNELLLDVLAQACLGKDNIIDNMCISAYEDACDYLEEKGLLTKINSRSYKIEQSTAEVKNEDYGFVFRW